MRPALHSDAAAAACVLRGLPEARRGWVLARMGAEAGAADAYRRAHGRMHPRWGNGSLMAAALRRRPARGPLLDDADYCRCLAQVYRWLGTLSPARRRCRA